MKSFVKCCVVIAGSIAVLPALASGGGPKVAEGVNYIAIEPALVVNYGGPGKARFIKAELSIRTETGADATEVIHHLPLVRDRLVSILSAQTEEAISTAEGKEYLRVYALAEINKALLKVEGHDVDEHGGDHGADKKKAKKEKEKTTAKHDEVKASEHKADEAHSEAAHADEAHKEEPKSTAVPDIASIKPVKGPASDLFFNNFVVQK
ncbi:MAG TPA: flagellar basal body-associated FliL family protein [Cellvibrio sp.]|nr:flagellar basal body-associated FliL family protein [Cellvibrio sp.]